MCNGLSKTVRWGAGGAAPADTRPASRGSGLTTGRTFFFLISKSVASRCFAALNTLFHASRDCGWPQNRLALRTDCVGRTGMQSRSRDACSVAGQILLFLPYFGCSGMLDLPPGIFLEIFLQALEVFPQCWQQFPIVYGSCWMVHGHHCYYSVEQRVCSVHSAVCL